MKPSVHLGGNSWSQPWHAMHRRLLQNGVRISAAQNADARNESWLVRARHRAAPRARMQASCDAL